MAKPRKQPRPKAETPKGFRDYFGAEVTERAAMLDTIAGVYHRYGFDALESSAVETVEALGKFLPDVDRPNDGVFAWQDEDDTWLALRYDLTAPLARVYAQHRNDLPTPYRRYAMGPVWRNEKPGPGRFRQFYQCDADTVGSVDGRRCRDLRDAGGYAGRGGHPARRLRGAGEQPEGFEWGGKLGGHGARNPSGPRRLTRGRVCCAPSTSSTRLAKGRARTAWQGRVMPRGLHRRGWA